MLKNLSIKHKIIGCTLLVIFVLIIILIIYFSVKPKTTTLQTPKFEGFQNVENWDINPIPWLCETMYMYTLKKNNVVIGTTTYSSSIVASNLYESIPRINLGYIPINDNVTIEIKRKVKCPGETTFSPEVTIYSRTINNTDLITPTTQLDLKEVLKKGRKMTITEFNNNLVLNLDGTTAYIDMDNPFTPSEYPPNIPSSSDNKYFIYLEDYTVGQGCYSSYNRFVSWDNSSETSTSVGNQNFVNFRSSAVNSKYKFNINFVGYHAVPTTANTTPPPVTLPVASAIKTTDFKTGYIYTITDKNPYKTDGTLDTTTKYLYLCSTDLSNKCSDGGRFNFKVLPPNSSPETYQFIIKETPVGSGRFIFVLNSKVVTYGIRACYNQGDKAGMYFVPRIIESPVNVNFRWRIVSTVPAELPKPFESGRFLISYKGQGLNTPLYTGCGRLLDKTYYITDYKGAFRQVFETFDTPYINPLQNPDLYSVEENVSSKFAGIAPIRNIALVLNIRWIKFNITTTKHVYQIYYNSGNYDPYSPYNETVDNNTVYLTMNKSGETRPQWASYSRKIPTNVPKPMISVLQSSSGTNGNNANNTGQIDAIGNTYWSIEPVSISETETRYIISSDAHQSGSGTGAITGSATLGACSQAPNIGPFKKTVVNTVPPTTPPTTNIDTRGQDTAINKPFDGIRVSYYEPADAFKNGLLWGIQSINDSTLPPYTVTNPTFQKYDIPTTI